MINKLKINKDFNVEVIQRYLLYALVAILPLAVVPLSWDWTERPMSLAILLISTIIVGLEVIKFIWKGNFSILKTSLDLGIFLLLVSFLLSTVFSQDINTSLLGIDGRLGNGLIVYITIFLVSISARNFINDVRHVKCLLFSFLVGMMTNNLLSLLSFYGVNIWGWIPFYKELFQAGLPIVRSAKTHILLNVISITISLGFIGSYIISKGRKTIFVTVIVSLFLSIINVLLFSITQGSNIVILFLVCLVLFTLFLVKRFRIAEINARNIMAVCAGVILLIAIPFTLLKSSAVREALIPDSVNLVGQVSLGTDISWYIASSSLVSSIKNGFVGLGLDTYSVAYNLYKPLNNTLVAYNSVNFYYAGNEILTQLCNGGILWFLVWLFFGFSIVKTVLVDVAKIRMYSNQTNTWYLIIVDAIMLLIYLSSVFVSYSVIIMFLLILLLSIRGVLQKLITKDNDNEITLRLWASNISSSPETNKIMQNISTFSSVLVIIVICTVFGLWTFRLMSTLYLLRAESYYTEQNALYATTTPTTEDKEKFIDTSISMYTKALKFDSNNPLTNRKLGLMYLERVVLAAEKYSDKDEEADISVKTSIGQWKNYAVDYIKKSVDLSGGSYVNWSAMTDLYMGLVGIGYYDYITDAIYSLEEAITLNPLNYELYYDKAQVYVISGNKDDALAALTQVLSINSQHIPSLVLAADINKSNGNLEVYKSYLTAAKTILEEKGYTSYTIYEQIVNLLNEADSN